MFYKRFSNLARIVLTVARFILSTVLRAMSREAVRWLLDQFWS